jgi:hypothetical protein
MALAPATRHSYNKTLQQEEAFVTRVFNKTILNAGTRHFCRKTFQQDNTHSRKKALLQEDAPARGDLNTTTIQPESAPQR